MTQAYDLKAVADYGVAPHGYISLEDAQAAIDKAADMIAFVTGLLTAYHYSDAKAPFFTPHQRKQNAETLR